MGINPIIRDSCRRIRRLWRARLRAAHAAFALLVLLTFGPGESLLCIIHCDFWLPIAYNSYFAAQHHHHHHLLATGEQTADGRALPAGAAGIRPAEEAPQPACALHSGPGGASPFHIPPSPVHEMIAALTMILAAPLLIGMRPAAPPGDPPRVAFPPPLRPPIPIAG